MSRQDFSHGLSKKQKIAVKEEEDMAAAAGYSKAHKVVDLNLKNENMIVCLVSLILKKSTSNLLTLYKSFRTCATSVLTC